MRAAAWVLGAAGGSGASHQVKDIFRQQYLRPLLRLLRLFRKCLNSNALNDIAFISIEISALLVACRITPSRDGC
jgi:hypothetical protein